MHSLSSILPWVQIGISILLIVSVLAQQSGAGVGGALGGNDSFTMYHTKRGAEKFFFYASIVLAVLFAVSAFLSVVIK